MRSACGTTIFRRPVTKKFASSWSAYGSGRSWRRAAKVEDRVMSTIREISPTAREVVIPADKVQLGGELDLPRGAAGLVLFAHGSGSSRHSPRNRFVAEELQRAGLGTL